MIELYVGSILDLSADAVVNPANEELRTGGGVDRILTYYAGSAMEDAKRTLGGCPTGTVVVTPGFALPFRYVIHTAPPRFYTLTPYSTSRELLLAKCYEASLDAAQNHGMSHIAFPALGTGAYNWPHADAAAVAIPTIAAWQKRNRTAALRVTLVFTEERHLTSYRLALQSIGLPESLLGS